MADGNSLDITVPQLPDAGRVKAGAELYIVQDGKDYKATAGEIQGPGGGVFYLASYGAKWDGVTDDTAAVNACIAAAAAAGSGTLMAPSGTGLVRDIDLPNNIILDLNGSSIQAASGANWVVRCFGYSATVRNGQLEDPNNYTQRSTTTTGTMSFGDTVVPVASTTGFSVGSLVSILKVNGKHHVSKVAPGGIGASSLTLLDAVTSAVASGAAVKTSQGALILESLYPKAHDLTILNAPIALVVRNNAAGSEHVASGEVYSVQTDAISLCSLFLDVNCSVFNFTDCTFFGTFTPFGCVGVFQEGRNLVVASGGHAFTNVNSLQVEDGWVLAGCQLTTYTNCVGDTVTRDGWRMQALCQKLRFDNLFAGTCGRNGVAIQDGCLGIAINGLYTRFNTTADLSVTPDCQVYMNDALWLESQTFVGGGTYNQVFPAHIGGAPGNEGLRVIPVPGAVNRIDLQGNIAGNSPILFANGTDANINMTYLVKGTGVHAFQIGGPSSPVQVGAIDAIHTYRNRPLADTTYDYQAPANGFSLTVPALADGFLLNPATTLATGALIMPAAVVDGQLVTFSSTQTITSLTISPNTGQLIVGAATTLGANQSLTYQYRLADTTWYPKIGSGVANFTTPQTYGALGNGSHDDTAAIQAAYSSGLPVLMLPVSVNYKISATLLVPSKAYILFAQGALIKAQVNFGDIPLMSNAHITPANAGARDTQITVVNPQLDGNKANNATATQNSHGINLQAADNVRILDPQITACKGDGVYIGAKQGDNSIFSTYVWIARPHITATARQGISLVCGTDILIEGPVIETAAFQGIDLELNGAGCTGARVKITDPIIRNCGTVSSNCGIAVNGNGVLLTEVTILGGSIDGQTGSGINYRDVDILTIDGTQINAPTQLGVSTLAGGSIGQRHVKVSNVHVQSPGAQGYGPAGDNYSHTFANCSVDGATFGFQVDSTALGFNFSNCRAINSGTYNFWINGATYCTFTGCVSSGVAANVGFKITNANHNVITGLISTANKYGLDEVGTSDKNLIVGNIVSANTTSQITTVGAGTVVANNIVT